MRGTNLLLAARCQLIILSRHQTIIGLIGFIASLFWFKAYRGYEIISFKSIDRSTLYCAYVIVIVMGKGVGGYYYIVHVF